MRLPLLRAPAQHLMADPLPRGCMVSCFAHHLWPNRVRPACRGRRRVALITKSPPGWRLTSSRLVIRPIQNTGTIHVCLNSAFHIDEHVPVFCPGPAVDTVQHLLPHRRVLCCPGGRWLEQTSHRCLRWQFSASRLDILCPVSVFDGQLR